MKLKMKLKKHYSLSIVIILSIVTFLLVNLASSYLLNSRIDLTENNIFTLSDSTERIVEQLDEQVHMRMYYTESIGQELGQIQTYAQRIRGLLEQYANKSDGHLQVEFIDPEPFSPQEDQANAFGLQAVPVNNQQLYFGLVLTDSVDNTEVIPFFNLERQTFLEYDITRLIYDLANPEKPIVGVLNWLPQQPDATQPIFFQQLSEQYQIKNIETTATSLPDDLDSLLVVHPQADINDDLSYAIDQYLINNGKLIVFVDPVNEDRQGGSPPSSNMAELFIPWGVKFVSNRVAADLDSALRVNVQTAGGARAVTHPAWLQLSGNAFNSEDPVTANLNQIRMISAGYLALDPSNDNLAFSPLVQTSANSSSIDKVIIRSPDPRAWMSGLRAEDNPLVLAARYSGIFNSAFPDSTNDSHISLTPQASNLIVVADVDVLQDRYWVEVRNLLGQQLVLRTADNGTLVLNAVDNMVGSSDLIGLRSRGVRERNFYLVNQLRQSAESEYQEQVETLEKQLRDTEAKINQLQQNKQNQDALILNDEQKLAIQGFQQQKVATRKQLRDLQLQLNREIENLGSWLKFINIILLPLIVLLLSFFIPSRLVRR